MFFWIHFYNTSSPLLMRSAISQVSILVFLDSLLQPSRSTRWRRRPLCFNPCFSGFTSTTLESAERAATKWEFQSLFFWIHFYNRTIARVSHCPNTSFNPCFSGFTSTTARFGTVIFFRILCFNPCFSGFTSTTFWPASRVCRGATRFNPCFSGFTSTTGVDAEAYGGNTLVSILVFLDSLLQLNQCCGPSGLQSGFNPCFSGFTSTTRPRRKRRKAHPFRFNPCFSGFTSTTALSWSRSAVVFSFQSLFFWIHFYNRLVRRWSKRP